MTLKAEHITSNNFSRFGRIVVTPAMSPTSQAADYKFWSDIADYTIEGETEIGICTVYRQPKAQVNGMERHMRTPEILIPTDAPFVLPLLLDGSPEDETRAFIVNPGEAVVINSAVWHGACLPKETGQSSYFVIFRKNTPHDDIEKRAVQPLDISL
jgi:ureidoglycolate hydrolase